MTVVGKLRGFKKKVKGRCPLCLCKEIGKQVLESPETRKSGRKNI